VLGNLIGRTADDQFVLSNGLAGVQITQANNNLIGNSPLLGNSIGYKFTAIAVDGVSAGNLLQSNQYTGRTTVPIDLGSNGSTINDTGDVDAGPNNLQNYPIVQLATVDGIVAGTFSSLPFRIYELQLYTSQLSVDGQNTEYRYLTSVDVKTDEQGNATWQVDTGSTLDIDQAIAAIAQESVAGSSEMSPLSGVQNSRDIQVSDNGVAEDVGTVTGTVFRSATDPAGPVAITLTSSDTTRATVPAQIIIPANANSVQFTIQILDDQVYRYDQLVLFARSGITAAAVELVILDNDNPWHHSGKSLDVNGDGRLSAIDALLIINELNSNRSGSLANRPLEFPPIFFDVSNDGNLTSFDALLVINGINTNLSVNGEGESSIHDQALEAAVIGAPWDDLLPSRHKRN
jgi:hypothetical protein